MQTSKKFDRVRGRALRAVALTLISEAAFALPCRVGIPKQHPREPDFCGGMYYGGGQKPWGKVMCARYKPEVTGQFARPAGYEAIEFIPNGPPADPEFPDFCTESLSACPASIPVAGAGNPVPQNTSVPLTESVTTARKIEVSLFVADLYGELNKKSGDGPRWIYTIVPTSSLPSNGEPLFEGSIGDGLEGGKLELGRKWKARTMKGFQIPGSTVPFGLDDERDAGIVTIEHQVPNGGVWSYTVSRQLINPDGSPCSACGPTSTGSSLGISEAAVASATAGPRTPSLSATPAPGGATVTLRYNEPIFEGLSAVILQKKKGESMDKLAAFSSPSYAHFGNFSSTIDAANGVVTFNAFVAEDTELYAYSLAGGYRSALVGPATIDTSGTLEIAGAAFDGGVITFKARATLNGLPIYTGIQAKYPDADEWVPVRSLCGNGTTGIDNGSASNGPPGPECLPTVLRPYQLANHARGGTSVCVPFDRTSVQVRAALYDGNHGVINTWGEQALDLSFVQPPKAGSVQLAKVSEFKSDKIDPETGEIMTDGDGNTFKEISVVVTPVYVKPAFEHPHRTVIVMAFEDGQHMKTVVYDEGSQPPSVKVKSFTAYHCSHERYAAVDQQKDPTVWMYRSQPVTNTFAVPGFEPNPQKKNQKPFLQGYQNEVAALQAQDPEEDYGIQSIGTKSPYFVSTGNLSASIWGAPTAEHADGYTIADIKYLPTTQEPLPLRYDMLAVDGGGGSCNLTWTTALPTGRLRLKYGEDQEVALNAPSGTTTMSIPSGTWIDMWGERPSWNAYGTKVINDGPLINQQSICP